MMHAIIFILLLAIAFGVLLGYAAIKYKVKGNPLAEKIDALLPQTQCGQCSYPGCKPYAKAIADGEAEINRCPPGGEATIHALADLLDVEPLPLDQNQVQKPQLDSVVRIVEKDCIGCTLCIQACPVDAIVGASKQMHTVIESECTGCDLCIPPCPVDCIEIIPRQQTIQFYPWEKPSHTSNGAALKNRSRGDA